MSSPNPALSEVPSAGHAVSTVAMVRRRWPWLAAGVLILAGGALWFLTRTDAPSPPPPVPDMEDHHVKAVLDKAHQAIVDNPRSGAAWGRLGMIYFANDHRGPALDLFIQAEKLDPADYRWPYLQGIFHYDRGKQQALECFERAHRLATTTDFPAYRLGMMYYMQGRLEDASRLFQDMLARSPGNGLASLGLGKVALEHNELAQAEEHFIKATEQVLSRREAFHGLMKVYTRKDLPEKSVFYQRLFDLHPSDGADYDGVVQEVVKAHATGLKQFLTKVRQHLAEQEYLQAAEVMENAVRQYPADAKALSMMAHVLLEMAQKTPRPEKEKLLDRAEVHLKQAVQINARDAQNWHRLGMIYLDRGRQQPPALRQALDCFEKSLAINSINEAFVVSHATCKKDMGELDQAIELLEAFARSRPDVPLAFAQLGVFLIVAGRDQEAFHFLWLAAQENHPAALERAFALAWRYSF